MGLELKASVQTKKKGIAYISLKELIDWYHLCNQAEGKSPQTIPWYNEMLRALAGYLEVNCWIGTLWGLPCLLIDIPASVTTIVVGLKLLLK